jgi:hypothetical protein
MADIFVYPGGIGNASTGAAQIISTVSTPQSVPLMMNATGLLVPNDGTKPIVGYAPIGGAAPGQAISPQGLQIVNVDIAAPYTVGSVYYMQSSGALSTTVSTHYAGTAISSTTLAYINETAANVAAANAIPTPIDPLVLDEGPATANNKVLTQNSFTSEPFTNGVIDNTSGAAGTIRFSARPHGVYFEIKLSAMPTNNGVTFATLPPHPSGYLNYQGIFNDSSGGIGGAVYVTDGLSFSLVRIAGLTGLIASQGFVLYA